MIVLGHPLLAAGLAAAGLPVLIHFLTRPRPRSIAFPTFRLLLEAGSGRQALDRLRTGLILALRTLAITALALLLAKPYWSAATGSTRPGEALRLVVLLDASVSLRATQNGIPLFTQARALAAEVLRGLEPGSAAGVILAGATPRTLLPALSNNLPLLHEGLARAEATWETCDVPAALALAAKLLDGRGSILVISDFQRTNWGAADFTAAPGISFVLRPVARAPIDNIGLLAVRKAPEEPVAGERLEIAATVFNSSPQRRSVTVRIELDEQAQNVELTLAPYASATGTAAFLAPHSGLYAGLASLPSDALSEDDRRHFAVRVRERLRALVLCDAERRSGRIEAFCAATALCPSATAGTGIQIAPRQSQNVEQAALENSELFVLVPPLNPPGRVIETLARRVADGARLVLFLDAERPDEAAAAASLINGLAGASNGALRPPFELGGIVRPAEPEPLAELATQGQILRLFHAADQADWKSLRFGRHLRTTALAERRDEVLAAFADGSPALALSAAGRGSAVYFNLPLAPAASNLAGSPLFPALLHECLRALRETREPAEARPGLERRLVSRDIPLNLDASRLRLFDSGGAEIPARILAQGRVWRWELPPADRTGLCAVRAGEKTLEYGVVNLDPREADTRPVALADIAEVNTATPVARLDAGGDLRRIGQARPLWPELLALAALCLAAETALLAGWRRREARP